MPPVLCKFIKDNTPYSNGKLRQAAPFICYSHWLLLILTHANCNTFLFLFLSAGFLPNLDLHRLLSLFFFQFHDWWPHLLQTSGSYSISQIISEVPHQDYYCRPHLIETQTVKARYNTISHWTTKSKDVRKTQMKWEVKKRTWTRKNSKIKSKKRSRQKPEVS